MRALAWAGDVLTSRLFWEVRILKLILSILIIWTGIIMTSEMILYTPTDYLPYLVLIGLIITTVCTITRAKTSYNEVVKAQLRAGTIKEAPGFGLDYMSAYVGTIIVGVIGAFLFPGMVYEALGATCDFAGCVVIALVWSVVVGIKGATSASEVVDLFRDAAKIKKLESDAKNN